MNLVTKPLGSLKTICLRKMWSNSQAFASILRCIWRRGILSLADVNARCMATAYESIKLDNCPILSNLWKNGYSNNGMSLVIKSMGNLRASCLRRPCSSLRTLTNLFRCIWGQVTLPLADCWCKMDGHCIWEHEGWWLSKGDGQLMRKNFFAVMHRLKMWQQYLGSHKAKVYTDNVSLKYFETQTQMNAKSLWWQDSLLLMKVDLIHKSNLGNVVPDVLSRCEEFQELRIIQTLWLMFASEGNLWCKIQEGYIHYSKAQRLLG